MERLFRDGHSYEEIAEILNLGIFSVQKHISEYKKANNITGRYVDRGKVLALARVKCWSAEAIARECRCSEEEVYDIVRKELYGTK